MQAEEYHNFLITIRSMSECPDIPSLVSLAMAELTKITGVNNACIVVFRSKNQLFNSLYQKNDIPGFRVTEPDPTLTLLSSFSTKNGLSGGFLVTGTTFQSDQHQVNLLSELAEHTAICIETISLLNQSQERINYLIDYDDLVTKLPNRRYLKKILNDNIAISTDIRPFALLFIDLDNLKYVNRKLGYQAGDKLLYTIAQRLAEFTRIKKIRSIPSRIGGDEFALLLPGIDSKEKIAGIAEEMLSAIKQPVEPETLNHRITASIGISMYPFDAETADDILFYAEQAMFTAKDGGKDRFVFFTGNILTEKQGQ